MEAKFNHRDLDSFRKEFPYIAKIFKAQIVMHDDGIVIKDINFYLLALTMIDRILLVLPRLATTYTDTLYELLPLFKPINKLLSSLITNADFHRNTHSLNIIHKSETLYADLLLQDFTEDKLQRQGFNDTDKKNFINGNTKLMKILRTVIAYKKLL